MTKKRDLNAGGIKRDGPSYGVSDICSGRSRCRSRGLLDRNSGSGRIEEISAHTTIR